MAISFPETGEFFERRYEIRRQVGSGGFARIYHAVQRSLERDVALKILKPEPFQGDDGDQVLAHREEVAERFQREARNVAQLRDPYTITLYDFGQTNEGLLYMVFEYIDGETLEELAAQEGPVASGRIASILIRSLSSLEEAHARGMLHRDIKPANVMVHEYVGRRDQVKVLDFGIAKAVLEEREVTRRNVTQEGMMMGTPRYMSPEQLKGEDIGPPSDFYSLALVAYELVTGHKAIKADDTVKIIERQLQSNPVEIPADVDVDPVLKETIEQMGAESPAERFQSAGEVIDRLREVPGADVSLPGAQSAGPAPDDTTRVDTSFTNPFEGIEETEPSGEPAALEGGPTRESPRPREAELTGDSDASPTPPRDDSPAGHTTLDDRTTAERPTPDLDDDDWDVSTLALLVAGFSGAAILGLLTVWWIGSEPSAPETIPKSETDAVAVDVDEITIETRPPKAFVELNGKRLGQSPIRLKSERVDFPVALRAFRPDGSEVVRTLDHPERSIVLELAPPPDATLDHGDDGAD